MGVDSILFELSKLELNWSGQTKYAQVDGPRSALVDLSNLIYAGDITANDIQTVLTRVNQLLNKYLSKED